MKTLGTALVAAGLVDASRSPEALARVAAAKKARRAARANRDLLIAALFSARKGLDKARRGKRSTVAAKAEIAIVQGQLCLAVQSLRGLV